ncbi:hypothetical protein ABW20_dc0110391 [Dactylellina cionopaga]|nr:hypothetical protein ABW20_dc0110391 [Dactylellina cionopaga]
MVSNFLHVLKGDGATLCVAAQTYVRSSTVVQGQRRVNELSTSLTNSSTSGKDIDEIGRAAEENLLENLRNLKDLVDFCWSGYN